MYPFGRGSADSRVRSTDHDQHKARRAALSRFFSMASVRRLEPVVAERVNALVLRLQDFRNVDGDIGVVIANHAFAALAHGKCLSSLMF